MLILTYHRFGANDEPGKTSVKAFTEHLEYLTAHYRVLPLSHIAEHLAAGKPLPSGTAALTIDDGYANAYELAYPLLRQYRVPATLFAATGFVDGRLWLWTDKLRYLTLRTPASELVAVLKGRTLRYALTDRETRLDAADHINSSLKTMPDEAKEEVIRRIAASLGVLLPALPTAEYRPITWAQAREMEASGVEIGSHTVSHSILTNVKDERLLYELVESKARLEEMLKHEVGLTVIRTDATTRACSRRWRRRVIAAPSPMRTA